MILIATTVALAIAQGQAPDTSLVNPAEAQALCGQYDRSGAIAWDAVPADQALLWQRTAVTLQQMTHRGLEQSERELDTWCAVRATVTPATASTTAFPRVPT